MPSEPGPAESAKDRLYRSLKAAILSRELTPGNSLVEAQVAERFGSSRTPAREALTRLAAEGFVDVIPRKGYFVSAVTLQDVLESTQLRMMVEPQTAALVAAGDTTALVQALEQNSTQHAMDPSGEVNREFHLMIARASGNRRLVRVVGELLDEAQRVIALDPNISRGTPDSRSEHNAIIEALRLHHASLAHEHMLAHLENSRERILHLFRSGQAAGRFPYRTE